MNQRKRRTIRLQGYDYSREGAYFVTICTKNRECFFGPVENGAIKLSPIGETANRSWLEIPEHFHHVRLAEFVIMPNHVHGIIVIDYDGTDIVRSP